MHYLQPHLLCGACKPNGYCSPQLDPNPEQRACDNDAHEFGHSVRERERRREEGHLCPLLLLLRSLLGMRKTTHLLALPSTPALPHFPPPPHAPLDPQTTEARKEGRGRRRRSRLPGSSFPEKRRKGNKRKTKVPQRRKRERSGGNLHGIAVSEAKVIYGSAVGQLYS